MPIAKQFKVLDCVSAIADSVCLLVNHSLSSFKSIMSFFKAIFSDDLQIIATIRQLIVYSPNCNNRFFSFFIFGFVKFYAGCNLFKIYLLTK